MSDDSRSGAGSAVAGSAPSRSVHVRAPGKINIFLAAGAVQDDGYHPLATIFQAVSLYEDVYATPSDTITVSVRGVQPEQVPLDERNLAVKAAQLLARETGCTQGVHLQIIKRVPVAGGMGGGSADAAAALVACDELWGTGLGIAGLHPLAAQLGSDVPFALVGGTAMGTGRGDRLTPVLARGTYEWVLVHGEEGLSAPHIYARFDEAMAEQRVTADEPDSPLEVPRDVLQALASGDVAALAEHMYNDLESPAIAEQPALAQTIADGCDEGALAGIVSGSGPTVALLCRDRADADRVARTLSDAGRQVMRAHGPVAGAQVIEA
ncbi:4-(cytidine 5'-diphospho)-2-C-methyl-D-erythritol kinase [Microbacterium sp. YY-01]|uniref:4-(cytidine 5'-diphospho)-2-C-methyl-D-erythritol kinase n=1 Tax=Microbacterium sp. YY-01 TaxID=3421634 RepID=UPI003D168AFE